VAAAQRDLRAHAWGPVHVERAWRSLLLRGQRASRTRKVGGAALVLAAAIALSWLGLRSFQTEPSAIATGVAEFERLALDDGSEVRFESGAELAVRERTETRVVVALDKGAARFRIRHDPSRLFRVEARDVEVEDLGTTFDMALEGDSVRVVVTEGSVRVSFARGPGSPRESVTLNAGEHGVYPARPRTAPAAEALGSATAAPAASQLAVVPPSNTESAAADWRSFARAGNHRRAYELLAPGGFRDVRNEPQDLLLASDVARLSRHPSDSAMLLRKLLTNHERDPRAPSAAFMLGWVLMNELGRAREAAQAFARAEKLSPRGNLAEDAVARAVEAWYRAGELSRANAELERYRSSYPNGRHTAMLQRLVGTP
jgi:transmembrane sensor